MKHVLLLKPGVTSSRAVLGDYEQWFNVACGGVRLTTVELHAGERAPTSLTGLDGIIMTGSPLSVTTPLPWMKEAADFMVAAAAQGTPVLGVCFGHQLLAQRLGGTVIQNPLGRELGTVTVNVNDAGVNDPLFEGLGHRLLVQATHEDVVTRLPSDATLLASNSFCAVQAFRWGQRVWGVQFHPEMTAASIRFCIDAAGANAEARESDDGARLLQRFVAML